MSFFYFITRLPGIRSIRFYTYSHYIIGRLPCTAQTLRTPVCELEKGRTRRGGLFLDSFGLFSKFDSARRENFRGKNIPAGCNIIRNLARSSAFRRTTTGYLDGGSGGRIIIAIVFESVRRRRPVNNFSERVVISMPDVRNVIKVTPSGPAPDIGADRYYNNHRYRTIYRVRRNNREFLKL